MSTTNTVNGKDASVSATASASVQGDQAGVSGQGSTGSGQKLQLVVSDDLCSKCGKPLEYQSKLASGKLYHFDCFVCASCHEKMTRYIVHGGKAYCPLCVHTMFEPQCAECGTWLFGRRSEKKPPVLALGHLYHSRCFQCTTCEKRIIGKFYISDLDKVYCPQHPPDGTPDEAKKQISAPSQPDTNEVLQEDESSSVHSAEEDEGH